MFPSCLLLCCESVRGIVVIQDFWATKCLTESLQAAIQPRRHMNRSLYAIVSLTSLHLSFAPISILETEAGGGGARKRGNKMHDLTKRRVFFNVRSCMNLQLWTLKLNWVLFSRFSIFMMHQLSEVGGEFTSHQEEGRKLLFLHLVLF